jgi:uncharacterized membrane protein YcaP (DUF421 family)
MFTVFIRTILLFALTVVVIRLMGKREMAQLQPFEFVITLLIADLAASPMGDIGAPLLYGVLPILALLMLHSAIALLSVRSQRFRRWMCGTPSVLIRGGTIQTDELRRLCYDLSDLLEAMRGKGVLNPADVGTAILETNGALSVFPNARRRPACPEDLSVAPGYEGIPLTLVMDGRLQSANLRMGGLDEAWLNKRLAPLGFAGADEIFFCSLDTQGRLLVQGAGSEGKLHLVQAMQPDQVMW